MIKKFLIKYHGGVEGHFKVNKATIYFGIAFMTYLFDKIVNDDVSIRRTVAWYKT